MLGFIQATALLRVAAERIEQVGAVLWRRQHHNRTQKHTWPAYYLLIKAGFQKVVLSIALLTGSLFIELTAFSAMH